MPGQKRDFRGKAKAPHEAPKVRNEFTGMFEQFRDELDQHHDRRERIIKASRDITALSKKMWVHVLAPGPSPVAIKRGLR